MSQGAQGSIMRNFSTLTAALAATAIPAIALAAPDGAPAPSGATGLITAITAMIVAGAGLLEAIRGRRRATAATTVAAQATAQAVAAERRAASADDRAAKAAAWADRLANAQRDGVVLVLSYPGTVVPCRALLETNGWRVAYYQVTQTEVDRGALLPGPHMIADVAAADAIVVEGLDEPGMARLASHREFRDNIRSGAGVALYTAGTNRRYDLSLWGMCDQGVTTPVTVEAAVRASLARREATARVQGIRPGQMATARESLLAAPPGVAS